MVYLIRGRHMAMNASLLWAFAALMVVISAWNGGWREALWILPFSLAIALVAFACFWQPRLMLTPEGVTVRNIVRTAWIPWPELKEVENRYGLYLHSSQLERKIPVWAVPSRAISVGYAGRASDEDKKIHLDWDASPGKYHYVMNIPQAYLALTASRTRLAPPIKGKHGHHHDPSPSTLRPNAASLAALAAALILAVYFASSLAMYS